MQLATATMGAASGAQRLLQAGSRGLSGLAVAADTPARPLLHATTVLCVRKDGEVGFVLESVARPPAWR